ncbi:SDR family oxidoreductase [soil metagenome]
MRTPHSAGTVLITGATSGIGLELTKLFAKDNYDLVLIARNKEQLTALSNDLQAKNEIFIKIIPLDLSVPTSSQKIFDELQKDGMTIDILVNNAGFATNGAFVDIPFAEDSSQITLNILALTQLTKLFLPYMLKQKSGKILNLASIAAFMPGPYMAVYYASKAYVLSFSEAIAEEVRGSGVTVTALCPGPTKTNFEKRANMHFKSTRMSPETVAKAGYEGLMNGKSVVFVRGSSHLQSVISRIIPHSLSLRVMKRFNK